MYGYSGKILHVDLTRKKSKSEVLKADFCKKYIGGNGFAIRLLLENSVANINPLSPENVLVFAVGPFAGTMVPTSGKYIVQSKSPLTGFMGEAVSSGEWGPMLKRAGYDAIVIKGKAKRPQYLFIDDDVPQFLEATDLWGKSPIETDELIRKDWSDDNVRVAAIGPGGENLVKYANITNDKYRQAGRTGIGAVMGSKNLKAVAVRGSSSVEVCELNKLMERCGELYEQCQGSGPEGYRVHGTPGAVSVLNELGIFPTRNWQESTFEYAEEISGEHLKKKYFMKSLACSGCPIACNHLFSVDSGPFKGEVGSMEFEHIYALGSNCGVGYFPAILKAANLCDDLGIDTISAGVTIGWAMECFEKGLLNKKDTGGLDVSFGNYETVIELVRQIGYRIDFGNFLADGVKQAASQLGKGSEYFAMHNKGLEFPGYDFRGLKASALGFNTSTRGGCHLRSSAYDFDLKGKVPRLQAMPEYGRLVREREDLLAIFDSLILCKFIRSVLSKYNELTDLYNLVTGLDLSPSNLEDAGARIYNLEKMYNVREGWKRVDDYPPPRILNDPIPSGGSKGAYVKKEEFDMMLDAYYLSREWSKNGVPKETTLNKLGLKIKKMEKLKRGDE